jgi:type IV pilus assembly protein PilQ
MRFSQGTSFGRFARVWRRVRVVGLGAMPVIFGGGLAHAASAINHVRDVRVHPDGDGAVVVDVTGTETPTYDLRYDAAQSKLVVDFANADVSGAPEALTRLDGIVGGVLTQAFQSPNGSKTRVTVNLTSNATYRVRVDGTSVHLALTPSSLPTPGALNAKTGNAPQAELEDVRIEHVSAGSPTCAHACDRVILSVTGSPAYALATSPQGRARLELKGTHVPDALKRTLDVGNRGVVHGVSTFQDDAGGAVVEIDRGEGDASYAQNSGSPRVQGGVTLTDGKIIWTFDGGGAKDGGASRHVVTVERDDALPDVQKIGTQIDTGGQIKVETTGGGEAGFASNISAQAAGGNGRFSGRRIDLDLKDADIHNILRLLADVGRVNIVTADDVTGNVTIRMRNVPWDQALDVVLQAKGLGMVQQGNLIRVAPMAQLQKERELKLAAAKQELDLAPLETRLIPVSYAQADELQARAKDFLSPRGSLAVDERTNVLIARDITGNLNHVEELVRSLDTQTPQVLIEARIVEATSEYSRDVGIQWGGDTTFSQATGNPTGVAFPSNVGVTGGNYDNQTPTAGLSPFTRTIANPNFAVNLPATTGTGQGGALGISLGSIDNNLNLAIRLSAAESEGLVRIVSSPRILTLDNREARINQGTLLPFSQVSAQGVQTTFQEAKLQLLVKPHVTAEGSVSMHVKLNRDEPDFTHTSARGDPTILKREAETDLLVMDGHTAVIGGIYTRNTGRNLDQVPFFGDIPILGVLFQRRRASDSRNELVIFLTPRIVNRAEALGR